MNEVMSQEVAAEEIKSWASALDVDLAGKDDFLEIVTKSLMRGKIAFSEDEETFDFTLRKPLQLDNGESLASIKLRELTAGQTQSANKADKIATMLAMISAMSKQPLGVIRRIKQRDINTMAAVFALFFS